MDATTHAGAAVLLAFVGILPLAMYLRRRQATAKGHGLPIAVAGSTALLLAGLAAAWL